MGGIGPKVEGFAFCLDKKGLEVVLDSGRSFKQHMTKEGAILDGEYALTSVILSAGYNIDSLLLAYDGMEWKKDHSCNLNFHPSRADTYFGISINPIEVIFHKTYWAGERPVSEEFVRQYIEAHLKNV